MRNTEDEQDLLGLALLTGLTSLGRRLVDVGAIKPDEMFDVADDMRDVLKGRPGAMVVDLLISAAMRDFGLIEEPRQPETTKPKPGTRASSPDKGKSKPRRQRIDDKSGATGA